MERDLDGVDLQLLKSAAVGGRIVPKNIHQQRRLDRLELEGYLQSTHQEPAESGASAPLLYHITSKGERAVARIGP